MASEDGNGVIVKGQVEMRVRSWLLALLSLTWTSAVLAASKDNNVEWDGLFADQGPLYMTPTEPTGATPVTFRLRVFRNDITSANIKYWDTADQAFHWVPMVWLENDATNMFDMWEGVVPASSSLKYYRFQINDGTATAWLNAAGITAPEPSAGDFWIVPNFHTPDWAKQAIYYQIFPDRFNDGDPTNDLAFKSSNQVEPQGGSCPSGSYVYLGHCAYQHRSWTELPQYDGDFFGGDLVGITVKIKPYLESTLGITALYLNPIFQSPSNHKYDTQDYTQVDPHFGTNKDLEQLISTAHASGISVILDGVFNHTSTFHRWFNQQHLYPTNGAAEAADSAWSDRYVFLHWPDTYCNWSGFASLPKLNYGSPKLRDDIYRRNDSILQTYLRAPYGVDGWRFDVAGDLRTITNVQNAATCLGTDDHAIWQEIRSYIKGVNSEALILGEEWGKASAWMNGKEWDAMMNYNGFNTPVSKWITCREVSGEASQCLSVTEFDHWLRGTLSDYPRPTQLAMMNSLSTHDIPRFLSRSGDDEWKMKLAIILQMTYIGSPAIYYGDEIGITGWKDPDNRRTFNWDKNRWNNTILDLYRRMIQLRKQVSAFRDGSFKTLLIDDANRLYAYGRWNASGTAIVILNNDSVGHSATVPAYQLSVADGTRLTDSLTGTQYTVRNGSVTVPTTALRGHYGVVVVSDDAH